MTIDLAAFARAYDGLAPYRDRLEAVVGDWAGEYWQMQRGRYEMLLEYIGEHVGLTPTDRTLDVGIFPGYFTLSLLHMGYDVQGVDLDPDRMLEAAAEPRLRLKRCNIDGEPLPYPDGSFDVVLFSAVLEHLRINPLQTMREFHRVLAPGGRIFVQTPNLGYWLCRARVLLGRGFDESPTIVYRRFEELGHPGHIRVYQMSELLELVRYVGFSVQHRGWSHFRRRLPRRPRAVLDALFGIVPSMRRQLVVTAVKRDATGGAQAAARHP